MTNSARRDGPAVDLRHLLVIGAGPGVGGAIAQRFAQGGYHLTLVARHTDGPAKLGSDLADTGAATGTVPAVTGLDLVVGDSEWLAVQGRTGHGKSTC